jgi:Integrase core domain
MLPSLSLPPLDFCFGTSPTQAEKSRPDRTALGSDMLATQARIWDRAVERRKYMVKRRRPSSQGWRTFLRNHSPDIAAMDLFVVPTIDFEPLYALVIVRLDRRALVWINVTAHPTAEWVARQITEAFPWDEAPSYMIRDRDRTYGSVVTRRLRAMGIRDKPTASASPWQKGFAERLIGSIRRECVDHIIVLGEAHLRRILRSYARYYNGITRIDPWIRIRRLLDRFRESDASNLSPSLADSMTTASGFKFLVHTGVPLGPSGS